MSSKSDKVRELLADLQTKKESIYTELNETTSKLSTARRTTNRTFAQMMDVKKRYNDSVKEEQLLKKRKNKLKEQKDMLAKNMESKQIQLSLAMQEEMEQMDKNENKAAIKEQKKSELQLLKKIKKLPEEMVKIIGSYLPYTVRIQLLESRKKTSALLNKMSGEMVYHMLGMMCTEQEFVNMLPPEEAKKQLRYIRDEDTGELVANRSYSPFHLRSTTSVENKQRIRYILNFTKELNSAFAYKITKMIHILFNPAKDYMIIYTMILRDRANQLSAF